MKKVTLKALFKRAILKTPSFFKRVQKVCIVIAGVCTALLAQDTVEFSEKITKILEYGIVLGLVATTVSQLAVDNPEDIHKPKKEVE